MLHILFIITLFASFSCFAAPTPANYLQVEYQQSSSIKKIPSTTLESLSTIPKKTYTYLSHILDSFYNVVTFQNNKKESKRINNNAFSIPIIANNKNGFQFEVFGRLADPSLTYLSNLSSDHALFNYISNAEQFNINNCDIALGAGVSFQTGKNSRIKIIISNSNIPGFGDSTTLFGFETHF